MFESSNRIEKEKLNNNFERTNEKLKLTQEMSTLI